MLLFSPATNTTLLALKLPPPATTISPPLPSASVAKVKSTLMGEVQVDGSDWAFTNPGLLELQDGWSGARDRLDRYACSLSSSSSMFACLLTKSNTLHLTNTSLNAQVSFSRGRTATTTSVAGRSPLSSLW